MLSRVTFVLVSSLAAIAVLTAALPNEHVDAVSIDRTREALLTLGPMPPICPTTCVYHPYCQDFPGVHRNHEDFPLEEDTHGGEQHSCAWSEKGCFYHSCGPEQEEEEIRAALEELESIVPHLDAGEIRTLQATEPRVIVNRERQLLQVLGCGERTLLSMRLEPPVVLSLFGE